MSSRATQLAPPTAQGGATLIPVKAFALAKGRLSGALEQAERAALARDMATHVVEAQAGLTVAICCDDEGVAVWAESLGASVIWCPGTDLNGAVQQGTAALRDAGYTWAAIAHGDLPLARSLEPLMGWPGVTLVPDRHRTGSNVIVVPTALGFEFSYGEGSLRRHIVEAVRLGRGLRMIHDQDLGWDVDHPSDLTPSAIRERYNLAADQ